MYGLSKLEIGIVFLLLIYVLGDFKTPYSIMNLFRTPFAGIFIFGILIYLFYNAHVIITLLYVFAVYELLKRANINEYDEITEEEEQFTGMKENFEKMLEGLDEKDEDVESDEVDQIIGKINEGFVGEEGEEGEEGYEGYDGFEGFEGEEGEEGEEGDEGEEGIEGEQQVYALNGATENMDQINDSEEIEAFSQFLGTTSLENEMVTGMAPVGLGTTVRYTTSPYSSSVTNVTGASLV